MTTHLITFAANSVAITYADQRSHKIIDFLFQHVPANKTIPPHITYHLSANNQTKTLTLSHQETTVYTTAHDADMAERLLGDICYNLADQSQEGLLFHAGALTWQGGGLILPGASGAGKSTLTAWLLTQGFDYLSDELVFIPHQANNLSCFTRPLNLKLAIKPVLSQFFDLKSQNNHILSGSQAILIPPTCFNSSNRLSNPALKLIIFPHYQPQAKFELRPLSKAQAGLALMQCLVNARNLPEHGFSEITRLAQQTAAYQLSYTNFAQIAVHLDLIHKQIQVS